MRNESDCQARLSHGHGHRCRHGTPQQLARVRMLNVVTVLMTAILLGSPRLRLLVRYTSSSRNARLHSLTSSLYPQLHQWVLTFRTDDSLRCERSALDAPVRSVQEAMGPFDLRPCQGMSLKQSPLTSGRLCPTHRTLLRDSYHWFDQLPRTSRRRWSARSTRTLLFVHLLRFRRLLPYALHLVQQAA